MTILTGEVEKLISLDAQLVEDIYKAIFSHSEESEEKTQIGSSRILGLTSTKKQDYEMVQYNLTEAFPKFLETAPENATRALLIALDNYVKKHHPTTEGFQACEQIASSEDFAWESENGDFIKNILLEAAKHPDPVHRPQSDHKFDEQPSWGTPAPRINAACGLMRLAFNPACLEGRVLATIKMLANDIDITNTIASTLYFASGGFHEKKGQDKQDGKVLAMDEKKNSL